jgi:nucleoside-diphosphate-sugar epimerase
MKRILITGENSFIGSSFEKWCSKFPGEYEVETISLKENKLDNLSFVGFDSIFHVAGIAHVSTRSSMKDAYFRINRDLAIQTAEKAKREGVGQFVFMSSINVFENITKKNHETVITTKTTPNPAGYYGQSKFAAEIGLKKLSNEEFRIAILRPPIVYGKGAKGNYPNLVSFAKVTPIFPDFDNRRSMIHIDNFCEFIRFIVDDIAQGEFHPQNREYACTSQLVMWIAQKNGHKIVKTSLFNPLIRILENHFPVIEKIFGDFIYDMDLSYYPKDYQIHTLKDSILGDEK